MHQKSVEIIKIHFKNGENLTETVRKSKTLFGCPEALCRTTMQKLVEKYGAVGTSPMCCEE